MSCSCWSVLMLQRTETCLMMGHEMSQIKFAYLSPVSISSGSRSGLIRSSLRVSFPTYVRSCGRSLWEFTERRKNITDSSLPCASWNNSAIVSNFPPKQDFGKELNLQERLVTCQTDWYCRQTKSKTKKKSSCTGEKKWQVRRKQIEVVKT